MPTDFFERQETARQNTTLLRALFVLAVLAIVALVHLVLSLLVGSVGLFDPRFLAVSLVGTTAVVLGAATRKIKEMSSGGGGRLVIRLGGVRVGPNTSDASERRLFNVIEEMAIASGHGASWGVSPLGRTRNQRVRSRVHGKRCGHRRHAWGGGPLVPSGVAGCHRTRVQSHSQRRHASQSAAHRLAARDHGDWVSRQRGLENRQVFRKVANPLRVSPSSRTLSQSSSC